MLELHRISRLRQPRSNRASTILFILTFSVFALLGHLAIEQQRDSVQWTEESAPATAESKQRDLWSIVQQPRF